jgi:hypothetical protein
MPHPANPDVVYGSCKGQYEVMNLKTGQSKNYWVGAQSLYGNPATDLILRFQRVSPMATSPHDPAVLYYGSQYLHRTRDRGVTWEKISVDLTAHDPCCQGVSGEPITRDVTGEEVYSTLYAIAESPLEKGVIWTGSNDGPFFVTKDDGKNWANVTPKDLPPGGRVQYIDASPIRKGSAYYAVYRYLLGDYQPYIYKTDDYGKTWTRLTDGKNGIPADWPTRVVREDPARPEVVTDGLEGPARWDPHAEDRAGPRHEVHWEDGTREQHGGKAQHRQRERRLRHVPNRGGSEQAQGKGRDGAQQQAGGHRGVGRQGAIGQAVQPTKHAQHRHDHDEEEWHEDCYLRGHVRAQPQTDEAFAAHDRALGANLEQAVGDAEKERGKDDPEADHHHRARVRVLEIECAGPEEDGEHAHDERR